MFATDEKMRKYRHKNCWGNYRKIKCEKIWKKNGKETTNVGKGKEKTIEQKRKFQKNNRWIIPQYGTNMLGSKNNNGRSVKNRMFHNLGNNLKIVLFDDILKSAIENWA